MRSQQRQPAYGVGTAKTCQTLAMTAVPALSHTGHARTGLHEPCVLLKLGEIVLKGKNRQQFERLLQNNIRLAAADLGVGIRLWQRDGVIVLNPAPAASPDLDTSQDQGSAGSQAQTPECREAAQVAADQIAERMLNVMGVVRVCRAVRVAKEAAAAIETATELAGGRPGAFAVRAKRRDKRFPVTSA